MKCIYSLALFVVLLSVIHAGEIRICVLYRNATIATSLVGAKVDCYDEDKRDDTDDSMTSGSTGIDGCTTLSYKNRYGRYWPGRLCSGWDCLPNDKPDIYCKVTKDGAYLPVRNLE